MLSQRLTAFLALMLVQPFLINAAPVATPDDFKPDLKKPHRGEDFMYVPGKRDGSSFKPDIKTPHNREDLMYAPGKRDDKSFTPDIKTPHGREDLMYAPGKRDNVSPDVDIWRSEEDLTYIILDEKQL